jgi:hypothetical protein
MSSVRRVVGVLCVCALVAFVGCGQNPSLPVVHPYADDTGSIDVALEVGEEVSDGAASDSPVDEPAADAKVEAADVPALADGQTDVTDAFAGEVGAPDTGAADAATANDVGLPCQTAADCPAAACLDATCVAGTCTATAKPDGAACPSADKCATSGACKQGLCLLGVSKPCSDDNACTADGCDPATGACVHEATAGAPCNDGNACTKDDKCGATGTCEAGGNACAGCTGIKDCAQYDDSNLCNGTLFCNLEKTPATCEVLPTSVVLCDGSADTGCAHANCNPASGLCELLPSANGAPCDDGNPCTQEACDKGQCTAKVNVCQCQQDTDCGAFDDGNACNGTLFCDKGAVPFQCKVNPATLVSCPKSSDPCLTSTCDAKTGGCGTAPAPANTPCSDGNPKTVGDTCVLGKCNPGVDTSVCKTTADCAKLEDGDLCNGTKFCNLVTGQCLDNPATVRNPGHLRSLV